VARHILILLFILLFTLPFCGEAQKSSIDSLTSPIILTTKNDSITEVKGAKGKTCILHTSDKVNYRIHFLKVGDTLEIE